MRVSARTKVETRGRILEAARTLFGSKGFDATTTRDLAEEAGIASGTLFNYFPTKEAVVGALATEAMEGAGPLVECGQDATLEEELFALIAAGLRKLKPIRKYLPALLETARSPLAHDADGDAAAFRSTHLEAVSALLRQHGHAHASATALQLYWTLYVGVLAFWARDGSPKQEDTLALIDDSVEMFATWIQGPERKR